MKCRPIINILPWV